MALNVATSLEPPTSPRRKSVSLASFTSNKSQSTADGDNKARRMSQLSTTSQQKSVDGDDKTRRMSQISNSNPVPSMLRRRSTFKSLTQGLTGLMRLRRLTMVPKEPVKPKINYENTYKTDPDNGEIFFPDKVYATALKIIEKELVNVKYAASTCGTIACELAGKLKKAVKVLHCPRYKIICQVMIGEIKDQGVEAASRCLWDEKRDNYTCVSYRNDTMFVSATIHAVYFE